jgi:type II secretory pathway component PulF
MGGFMEDLFQAQVFAWREVFMALLQAMITLTAFIVVLVVLAAIWLAVSARMRRQERARCFLQLLETGLQQGRQLEETILSLARDRVQTLGVRLHLVAAHLESGLRLSAALDAVPQFLPAPIRAMLKVGEELGDVAKVLPACRGTLRDGSSGAQSTVNSVVVLLFVSPLGPVLIWFLGIWVFPKLKALHNDMIPGMAAPWHLFEWSTLVANVALGLWVAFALGTMFAGTAGPRWLRRLLDRLGPVTHHFALWLPWRRRRIQRDFSTMLALLLDAEVPEEKAVRLAAQSSANVIFLRRAERVVRDLREGVKLTEAVRWLDGAGEFRWRLRNAAQAGRGFVAALAGWHEVLEAKAYQQEQAVSQMVTTGFVFLNGLMVSLLAVGVFQLLLAILEEAAW